jgi:hypothetical protein
MRWLLARNSYLLHHLVLVAGMLSVAPAHAAQSAPPPPTPPAQQGKNHAVPVERADLRNFEGFLNNHPDVRQQLTEKPTLINNKIFMESHQDLGSFLNKHPDLHSALQKRPDDVLRQMQADRKQREQHPRP